jgi:hypothetical protein
MATKPVYFCKTRGRSYTSFPRNTAVRFRADCARLLRLAEQVQEEIETCYGAYQPVQVFHQSEMRI